MAASLAAFVGCGVPLAQRGTPPRLILPEWVSPAASLAGAILVLAFTYLGARRLGLTDLQKAVAAESERLISRLKDRVAQLEQENNELHRQVDKLVLEAGSLGQRVDDLEAALADQAVARRRPARG